MKKIILSGVFAIAICLVGGTGCSQKVVEQPVVGSEEISAFESVKMELTALNMTYMETATKGSWWRYLVLAAADAAGGLCGGGVAGAVSASTLAWTVTGTTKSSAFIENAIKEDNLSNLEAGSIGYVHNSVISNMFEKHEDLYSRSYEEIISLTLEELEDQTDTMISEDEKTEIINSTISVFGGFDAGKSVEEYVDDLINQTSDTNTKQALELCGLVLQGLQYVDDNDTTYIEKATSIVSESAIDSELKSTTLDGMSVAYASAKLWNTDSL